MDNYRLSEKAISQLKQEHRKAKAKWEADRLKTIYLLGEGWQPEVVANIGHYIRQSCRSCLS